MRVLIGCPCTFTEQEQYVRYGVVVVALFLIQSRKKAVASSTLIQDQ